MGEDEVGIVGDGGGPAAGGTGRVWGPEWLAVFAGLLGARRLGLGTCGITAPLQGIGFLVGCLWALGRWLDMTDGDRGSGHGDASRGDPAAGTFLLLWGSVSRRGASLSRGG